MTTVEQVAHAALADLGAEAAGMANAVRWVNERISHVASRRMKHRRRIGGLVIPAAITAGTVTLTNGQREITGDATAIAAWANKPFAHTFLQIATSGVWYRITTASGSQLVLEQPFEGTTVTSTYRIVSRYTELPVEAAFLGHFALNRLRREIMLKSQSQLDMHVSDRAYVTGGAYWYSLFGEANGKKIVEFYPYSTQDEYVLFTYWEVPPVLNNDDIIPTPFTAHDLKHGVHADIYQWMAATEKDVQTKGFCANMSMKCETRWDKALSDIMRRDRDVEDLVLLFKHPRPDLLINWNAHSEVYFRGNRP